MNQNPNTAALSGEKSRSVNHPDMRTTIWKAIWVSCVVLAIAGVWVLAPVLLLIFCSILLAIVIDGAARMIAHPVGLPRPVGLVAAFAGLCGLIYLSILFFGTTLTEQFTKLVEQIEWGIEELRLEFRQLTGASSSAEPEEPVRLSEVLSLSNGLFDGAATTLMTFLGAVGGLFLVVAMASYLAVSPRKYLACAMRLVPKSHRLRARKTIETSGTVLRRWLVGQGVSMVFIGTLSFAGLAILDVPLAFVLAVFAGLMAFIPIVGPVIGGVAMVLVAVSENWPLAMWTAGLYLFIQLIESYLLTPIIQRQAVYLLPGIILAAQFMMGALFGLLGLALATPLAAIILAVVQGADPPVWQKRITGLSI